MEALFNISRFLLALVFECHDPPIKLLSPTKPISDAPTVDFGAQTTGAVHSLRKDTGSKSGMYHTHTAHDARFVCKVDIQAGAQVTQLTNVISIWQCVSGARIVAGDRGVVHTVILFFDICDWVLAIIHGIQGPRSR